MSKQPEALRLADSLSCDDCAPKWLSHKAAAELRRLHSVNADLLEALASLLDRDERNTCQHESTYRGGVLWTICESCGAQWADDEGGKPEWKDPHEWVQARAALAKAEEA